MARERIKNIVLPNAKIIFRNFAGKGDRFNPQGRRSFGVLINNEDAPDLIEEGWHIKWLKARDEDEEPQAYLPIRVNYSTIPPMVYMVTKNKKILLTESNVNLLDNADLENVDLEITPYFWTIPTKDGEDHGITAYLKTGYFTIVTDAFYDKYSKFDEQTTGSDSPEIPFE